MATQAFYDPLTSLGRAIIIVACFISPVVKNVEVIIANCIHALLNNLTQKTHQLRQSKMVLLFFFILTINQI